MERLGTTSPSLCASNSKLRFHPGPSASFPGSIKFAVSFVRPRCAVVQSAFRLWAPECGLRWSFAVRNSWLGSSEELTTVDAPAGM